MFLLFIYVILLCIFILFIYVWGGSRHLHQISIILNFEIIVQTRCMTCFIAKSHLFNLLEVAEVYVSFAFIHLSIFQNIRTIYGSATPEKFLSTFIVCKNIHSFFDFLLNKNQRKTIIPTIKIKISKRINLKNHKIVN